MSSSDLQWIVTAYSLTFGGFLLLGGRSADLFGRRRSFLAGIIVFTLASLGSGLSQSGDMIIVFRALQGLSGAFMSPAALSIVLVTYREGHERNVALSVWGAVASAGAAVGVLAGGIITQYLTWRWNFIVNVPVGIFIVLVALRILPKHESEADHNSLDLPGAILVTGSMMTLVYALVEAPTYGWLASRTLILFGVALVALLGFVFNEAKAKHPLIPLRIFRIRNLSGADSIMLLMAAGMLSVFYFCTLYLQEVLHYSPIHTGLSFLIIPVIIAIAATNVPRIIMRVGYKPILMIAPLFVSGGLFWLSHIHVHENYWTHIAPGLAMMGLGMGCTFVSATIAATSGVEKQESGLASGILNTAQQIGGAIGLAVLSGVAISATQTYTKNLHHVVRSSDMVAAKVRGYHYGFLIASCFGIVASIVASIVLRSRAGGNAPVGDEPISVGA